MKKIFLSFALSSLFLAVGCGDEPKAEEVEVGTEFEAEEPIAEEAEPEEVVVQLESRSGSDVTGVARFTEADGEVTLFAEVTGLPAGMHAIHLHENGDCSAEDASSAGGHWNPTGEDHGEWGSETGFHRGDIGNFEVNAEGVGTVNLTTDLWCIGCEDEERDILNKSVIVHAGSDDMQSQPSGAAGHRLACGVIAE